MIIYITKYATTKGIIELDTAALASYKFGYGNFVCVEKETLAPTCYHAGEWYTSKAMAIVDAEHRREKKIASLKKQITKLEAIDFGKEND